MGCQIFDGNDNLIAIENITIGYTTRVNTDLDFEDLGSHTMSKFVLYKSFTKHSLDSIASNSKFVKSTYTDAIRIETISKIMKISDLLAVRNAIAKFKALKGNL